MTIKSLTIRDIQAELACSIDHARNLVMDILPHYDIGTGGRASWRVKRADFDRWMEARRQAPDTDRIEQFARKHTR